MSYGDTVYTVYDLSYLESESAGTNLNDPNNFSSSFGMLHMSLAGLDWDKKMAQ